MTKDTPIKDKIQAILKGDITEEVKPKAINDKGTKDSKAIIRPLPTKIVKEVPEEIKSKVSLDEIEFQKIANSSEFKRLVYLIWFGKTHRGKSNDLERQLVERKKEITVINEIGRGTSQDFRSVVNELKETLAKRKIEVEDQD